VRRGIVILFALTLGWALFAGASTASADTNVSLTFDDGNADQMPAVQMLTDHGMEGTFYIIPGRVGRTTAGYMTWTQVQTIYAAGNEIGGHTQNHVHLDELSEQEQHDEICGGRDSLLARGYPQVSFAYPFGDHNATSEEQVEECGYLSGRRVGGIGGTGEPKADTIPPENQWLVRTRGSIDVDDTLPEIKDWIMDAEALDDGNGSTDVWFTLVFHHLCDPAVPNSDCDDPDGDVEGQYISPQNFDALLDFLEARESNGTSVKTMAEVMTGQSPQDTTAPVSQIKCDNAACQSGYYNHSVSATLSATDTGGSGLKEIRYTTNGSNPTTSSPLYTGPITVNSTTTIKYRAWDNAGNAEAVKSQLISIDTAKPTSAIQCNGGACASTFYNQSVSTTFTGSDTGGSGLNGIRYTTDGSTPTGSSPLYVPGSSSPVSVGSTTTIKFLAQDKAGNLEATVHSQAISVDTAKPTSAIQCNGASCSSGFYNAPVSATLSGTDTGGSGLKNIRYTTDGSNPTGSSPIYTSAIAVNSTTTIKFRAEDNAGNVESPVKSQTITIDTVGPTSAIQCDAAACSSSFYNHAVSATLSGSDTGGSGLKNIRYTTDGSSPTASSPIYSSAINVGSTTTIKWRAEDNAGNVESPVRSQTIQVDTTKPTSSIECNGASCSSGFYNAPVSATLSATDNSGGSGVKNIRYTTNGADPTGSSPIYTAPIPVNSTTTIKFRAEDNAGNVESSIQSQTITIDTAKPTSSILCDGAACAPSYDHAVAATLSGDDSGGSGLKDIRYTTDGSDPSGSSPIYSDPIEVASTTTIKFRAEDNAGNVESPVHSQTIEITSPPPPDGGGGGGGGSPGSTGGTLGAFASSKSLLNGTVKLTLEVTGPGELEAVDGSAGGTAAAAAEKKRTAKIKPALKSVAQAGEVTLTLRTSKAGKRILRRKGKLTLPVRVTFTPVSGSPTSQTVKVRFRINLKG
jgi:peptidoglycan/xylan/chitin deacetylase (PgdA/CDA1 family)